MSVRLQLNMKIPADTN